MRRVRLDDMRLAVPVARRERRARRRQRTPCLAWLCLAGIGSLAAVMGDQAATAEALGKSAGLAIELCRAGAASSAAASCLLEAIAHAIKRFDHLEGILDHLELLAQPFDVAVDRSIVHIDLVVIGGVH